MKKLSCLLPAVLFVAASLSSSAAVTITGSDETPGTTISQMPGSPTDYLMFSGSSVLNDFTETTLPGVSAFGAYPNTSITTPENTPSGTGIIFEHPDANVLVNLATFTLGNSTTFNYSNFNVFVLYDNTTGDPASVDAAISLALGSDATGASATVVSVTDPSDKPSNVGRIVEFNVQGLSAGDELTFGASAVATGVNFPTAYIGGVSFESVAAPEPSTYALMIGGLALLGLAMRNARRFGRA